MYWGVGYGVLTDTDHLAQESLYSLTPLMYNSLEMEGNNIKKHTHFKE